MEIVREMETVAGARPLRRTLVRGVDGKRYAVVTSRLYDFTVGPGFATHETAVEQVPPEGGRRVLVQPFLRRFFGEREALAFHQDLLEKFDETLRLKPAAP